MKRDKIIEGNVYEVKVGKNTTTMRVMQIERRVNGQVVFDCMNTKTNKRMTVSDEKRFVKEVKPSILQTVKAILPKSKGKKADSTTDETVTETVADKPKRERTPREDGTYSGLEAALIVLRESGEPMNIKQIMERINERGLAKLNGKTPDATVSAAMQREIGRGESSRFVKAGKGLFAAK